MVSLLQQGLIHLKMGKDRRKRRFYNHLIILGLCLGSIALCVLADPMVFAESQDSSIPGGTPGHSLFDEHEEDFVLMKAASTNTQAIEILAKMATHLPDSSHPPTPITPPPKFQ
jgi:hypothetical protein